MDCYVLLWGRLQCDVELTSFEAVVNAWQRGGGWQLAEKGKELCGVGAVPKRGHDERASTSRPSRSSIEAFSTRLTLHVVILLWLQSIALF